MKNKSQNHYAQNMKPISGTPDVDLFPAIDRGRSDPGNVLSQETIPAYARKQASGKRPLMIATTKVLVIVTPLMEQFRLTSQEYQQDLLSRERYFEYLSTFDNPGIFEAFQQLCEQIRVDSEYWRCLSLAYVNKEIHISDRMRWWLALFEVPRGSREEFMLTPEDRIAFDHLPDVLTVYRGYQRRKTKRGLSWTLSKYMATWFACRWGKPEDARLVTGTCRKSDVLGYCNDRDEQEIIINPANIKAIKHLKIEKRSNLTRVASGSLLSPVQTPRLLVWVTGKGRAILLG